MKDGRPILLVEDDDVDAITVIRAFKELQITNVLHRAKDGEEGLDYLEHASNELPCIILLDLNTPRMDGIEFLKRIKYDERFAMIPVVVLTTSREEHDLLTSFRNHAAGYMIKPIDYRAFVETVRMIHMYWTLSETP